MIVQEHIEIDGRDFIHTYSDSGKYIIGGLPYGEYIEANDPAELNREYIEGRYINENEEINDKAEIFDIIFGGGDD